MHLDFVAPTSATAPFDIENIFNPIQFCDVSTEVTENVVTDISMSITSMSKE